MMYTIEKPVYTQACEVIMRYNNYLFDKIESKFLSSYLWSDPNKTARNLKYDFRYKVVPEEGIILEQAKLFSKYFIGEGYFTNSFLDNANRLPQIESIITEVYVYSYVKSVYYACLQSLSPGTVSSFQKNNLVFKGHKILFDHILEGYMPYFSSATSTVSLQIDGLDETMDEIKAFECFKNNVDDIGFVFNSQYETILNFMINKCSNVINISNLSDVQDLSVKYLSSSPLGNACYSPDMQTIFYVENSSVISDTASIFWNKACMISALSFPSIDVNDSVYDDIPISRYSKFNISHEIYSITGYNPFRRPASYTGLKPQPNGYSPSDNLGGGNSQDRNSEGRVIFASVRKSKGNQNDNSGINNAVLKNAVRLSDRAVNLLRDVHVVLNNDNVKIVAGILCDLLGKRITAKQLNKFKGKPLEEVYKGYNVPMIDNTKTDEYSAFYVEQGDQKLELVAYPKTIVGLENK